MDLESNLLGRYGPKFQICVLFRSDGEIDVSICDEKAARWITIAEGNVLSEVVVIACAKLEGESPDQVSHLEIKEG